MTELSPTVLWLTILILGVGTYLLRASFLLGIEFFGGLPPAVKSVLPLVPLAVLAALAAPYLALPDGTLSISPYNEQLVAGLVAFVIARITENLVLTIAGGMLVLWTLQFL
jgi:branched-subunit amino acid transport protein